MTNRKRLQEKRILIVEDDQYFCNRLKQALQWVGIESSCITKADCMKGGLKRMTAKGPFDLAIVDVRIPKTSAEFKANESKRKKDWFRLQKRLMAQPRPGEGHEDRSLEKIRDDIEKVLEDMWGRINKNYGIRLVREWRSKYSGARQTALLFMLSRDCEEKQRRAVKRLRLRKLDGLRGRSQSHGKPTVGVEEPRCVVKPIAPEDVARVALELLLGRPLRENEPRYYKPEGSGPATGGAQRWIDPSYLRRMIDVICDVQAGEYPCLRDLTKHLRDLVYAKEAGFVWFEHGPRSRVRSVFSFPADAPVGRWFRDLEVRRTLEEIALTLEPADHVSTVIGQGEPLLQRLDIIEMPSFSQQGSGSRTGFVWFRDRLARVCPNSAEKGLDLLMVSSVLKTWAWRVAHDREHLLSMCSHFTETNEDGLRTGDHEDLLRKGMVTGARTLHRMLDLPDIVRLFNACASADGSAALLGASSQKGKAGACAEQVSKHFGSQFGDWDWCPLMRGEALCFRTPPGRPMGKKVDSPLRQQRRLACCLSSLSSWGGLLGEKRGRALMGEGDDARKERHYLCSRIDLLRKKAAQKAQDDVQSGNILPPNANALQSYFLSQALGSIRDRFQYWTSVAASSGEVALALSSIARSADLILGRLPLDDDGIQGLIWMLSEYAHYGLGVPARIDLRAHLLQAARHEPALHVLKPYYRDHFFHALEVCFLGHYLLDVKLGDSRCLWDHAAEKIVGARELASDARRRFVLRLWYVASLLHDVGYLIDVLQSVGKQLTFFGKAEPLKQLIGDLDEAVKRLSLELGGEMFVGYLAKQKPGQDHGVIAARHLQGLLESVARDDQQVKREEYRAAIRAIAFHNSQERPVSFERDPLAFLLILCDTLQEWNRPSLSFATAPAQMLAMLLEPGSGDGWPGGPLKSMGIKVDKGTELQFVLTFDEGIGWNANVFRLWLDASRNLQRLEFDGLPEGFDIRVEYVTPPFRGRTDEAAVPQLHRLRDAARETHMNFLEGWFPKRQGGQGAVIYDYIAGERPRMEHLTLSLSALSKEKPVTKGMDEFYARLPKWRHFNEDQRFPGDYAAPASAG